MTDISTFSKTEVKKTSKRMLWAKENWVLLRKKFGGSNGALSFFFPLPFLGFFLYLLSARHTTLSTDFYFIHLLFCFSSADSYNRKKESCQIPTLMWKPAYRFMATFHWIAYFQIYGFLNYRFAFGFSFCPTTISCFYNLNCLLVDCNRPEEFTHDT